MSKKDPQEPRAFAYRNDWLLLRHPAFRAQFDALVADVTKFKTEDPAGWMAHPKTKMLVRIRDLIEAEIPANPDAKEFQLGNTLGTSRRHWRRAKFLDRFRLFFRFDSKSKVIIYAWVNDENTLRKAGSSTDPYAVFEKLLNRGDPPDDWAALLKDVPAEPAPASKPPTAAEATNPATKTTPKKRTGRRKAR
jgi:toxin YhaV